MKNFSVALLSILPDLPVFCVGETIPPKEDAKIVLIHKGVVYHMQRESEESYFFTTKDGMSLGRVDKSMLENFIAL